MPTDPWLSIWIQREWTLKDRTLWRKLGDKKDLANFWWGHHKSFQSIAVVFGTIFLLERIHGSPAQWEPRFPWERGQGVGLESTVSANFQEMPYFLISACLWSCFFFFLVNLIDLHSLYVVMGFRRCWQAAPVTTFTFHPQLLLSLPSRSSSLLSFHILYKWFHVMI